jgi:transcription antitermination factor NusG
MKLVKIGASTINMDVVREIRETPGGLTIVFLDGHEIPLRGAEMQGLQRWLRSQADEVVDQPHHQSTARPQS